MGSSDGIRDGDLTVEEGEGAEQVFEMERVQNRFF